MKSTIDRYLFEILSLILVVTFITMFLHRTTNLSITTERLSVKQSLILIESALTQQLLRAALNNELHKLPQWVDSNPMLVFSVAPINYLGELTAAEAELQPTKHWYFDPQKRRLIYRAKNLIQDELEFRLNFRFEDKNKNAKFELTIDKLIGLRLEAVKDYHVLADKRS